MDTTTVRDLVMSALKDTLPPGKRHLRLMYESHAEVERLLGVLALAHMGGARITWVDGEEPGGYAPSKKSHPRILVIEYVSSNNHWYIRAEDPSDIGYTHMHVIFEALGGGYNDG